MRGISRDETRLLVMKRPTNEVEHTTFNQIGNYLNSGDIIVLNDSKTINALLHGWYGGNRRVEVRLCSRKTGNLWYCLIGPIPQVEIGERVVFNEGVQALIVGRHEKIQSLMLLRFSTNGDFFRKINAIGRPILSPYISRKFDLSYFQNTYAKKDGSAEMPAAGRHFTPELVESLRKKGISHVFVTLHTGLSSMSVKETTFEEHKMYEEEIEVDAPTASQINETKERGGHVVGVGTTVTRTLETAADSHGLVRPFSGSTDLYIFSGYRWKVIDRLITNFHGPRTSRIALAAAFTGKELLMRGYKEAIEREYKFYEFGDTTLTI